MARRLVSFIFIFSLIFQTFTGYVVLAEYALNQRAYIQKCVNKVKPILKCHGKCQLAKKINQSEGNQESRGSGKVTKPPEVISSKFSFATLNIFLIISKKSIFGSDSSDLVCRSLNSIFHPPKVV
jgi:hypothetical protein